MSYRLLRGVAWLLVVFVIVPLSPVFASDIVINEFLIDPTTSQWVELYNVGSGAVDISGWIIDDTGSESKKYTIVGNTMLPSHTCIVFSSGNFNFNKSSADGARLLSGETVIDTYSYAKSPGEGISFLRIPDGSGQWATGSASPGSLNSTGDPCLPPPTPTPTYTPTPTLSFTALPTNTQQPSSTSTPTLMPTATTKSIRRPTTRYVSDILGIENRATDEAALESEQLDPVIATPAGRPGKPIVFSLLFIGVGTALLSTAFAFKQTDVWKQLIGQKKEA